MLTVLGLFGLVTPDSIASSRVWRGLDRYANRKIIPQEVQDKIIEEDLSGKDGSWTKGLKCADTGA